MNSLKGFCSLGEAHSFKAVRLPPIRRRRHNRCRCTASYGMGVKEASADLVLSPPPGGADIFVFGAIHGDTAGSEIGEFILSRRPETVVVETALNDSHGSATGNSLVLEDCLLMTPGAGGGALDGRTLAIARLGGQLAATPDPLSSSIWADVAASPQFYSEHLAYLATFASQARLVHGDRPKQVTYQRMLWCPSVVDLDSAFGVESASNYHSLVTGMQPPKTSDSPTLSEYILITERDAVLLQSLHEASLEAGPGAAVVGVVGASHIPGMHRLWTSGEWRDVIESGALELPLAQKTGNNEGSDALGVRRALFDGIIRLICRPDVTMDIASTLGPPPAPSAEAYALTNELYGSSRMLLATLGRDQLAEVCLGWQCDMWDILEPLRAVRPVNGGPGFDRELVLHLRTLNYELG